MSEISILGGDVEHAARRSTEELADFATGLVGDAPGRALPYWPCSAAADLAPSRPSTLSCPPVERNTPCAPS